MRFLCFYCSSHKTPFFVFLKQNKLFYVALYHGNIFVRYNVGKGLSEPLQTKGEKLNNGQWQLVTIQFTALRYGFYVCR